MKYKFIFYISIIISTYLLFQLFKEDSEVTFSWITADHINEAAEVLEPVLPTLEEYFFKGNKRLPKNLQEVDLGYLETMTDNKYIAGLAIQRYALVIKLKDQESSKRSFFSLTPQPTTTGLKWNCNIGKINPQFFDEPFPNCMPASATPYGLLMEMVEFGLAIEAKKAIALGANVNRIVKGRYPLYMAIKNKSSGMVKLLINAGANVNLVNKDDFSKTPLMYAIEQDDLKIIKILVENGADVNATDSDGESVLEYVEKEHYELEDYLVEHGARVKL